MGVTPAEPAAYPMSYLPHGSIGPMESPAPRKIPPALIVAMVAGVLLAMVLMMVVVVAGGVAGYYSARARKHRPHGAIHAATATATPTPADPTGGDWASIPLSQSHPSVNGLVVAHYPADFKAWNVSETTVLVVRTLAAGPEAVELVAVDKPKTPDLETMVRLATEDSRKKADAKGTVLQEIGRGPEDCLPGVPGFGVRLSLIESDGKVLERSSCYFRTGGHAYSVGTLVPRANKGSEIGLLKRIATATELTGGSSP